MRASHDAQQTESQPGCHAPSAECLDSFTPRPCDAPACRTGTARAGRREGRGLSELGGDKPGGAVDVPPSGQTRHGRRGRGRGEWPVSVLTFARTFSKEAGLTREKHIKNTSWERTKETAS